MKNEDIWTRTPSGLDGRVARNNGRNCWILLRISMGEGHIMNLKSLIYRLLSISNDVNAVRKGPKAIGKRLVRKAGWKWVAGRMRKV